MTSITGCNEEEISKFPHDTNYDIDQSVHIWAQLFNANNVVS